MAVKKNNSLSGAIGPAVTYERNGKECWRSKPKKYKLDKNSRLSASDFGNASSIAKLIRLGFSMLTEQNKDTETHNRLTSIAADIVNSDYIHKSGMKQFHTGDVELLMNFQFNIHTDLRRTLRLKPEVHTGADAITEIRFPELNAKRDIKIPKGTTEIKLRVNAIAFDFAMKTAGPIPLIQELSLSPRDISVPATAFSFDTMAKEGNYIIVVLAVNFVTKDYSAKDGAAAKKLNPAAIISLERVS